MLIETMDPDLYRSLKEIVMRDMKKDIDLMKLNGKDCTEKCKLKNRALDLDLQRNSSIIQKFLEFKWCDNCSAGSGTCQARCG